MPRRRRASRRPAVTITRDGQHIFVRPACQDVLGVLEPQRFTAVADVEHGYRLVRQCEPLWPGNRYSDTLVAPAGIIRPIYRRLCMAGYTVDYRLEGNAPRPLPPPPAEISLPDRWLVEEIRNQHHMIVRYGEKVDPMHLVTQIARGYPEARIAVVTGINKRTSEIRRRLGHFGIAAATVKNNYCPETVTRVFAATFYALAHERVAIAHVDIVIVLDAFEAIYQRNRIPMEAAESARLIGLLSTTKQPSPRERGWLRAYFGDERLTILRHGRAPLGIDVVFDRVSGGPSIPVVVAGAELRRRAFWQAPVRNRRIAQLAESLARGDMDRLRAVEGHIADQLAAIEVLRVGVLVYGVEQAIALAVRLPGWCIVTGPAPVFTGGMSESDIRLLDERTALPRLRYRRAIITLAALDTAVLSKFDVLIRADGGIGLPPALAKATVPARRAGRRLLVVDFNDQHHPVIGRWSRQRRDAYVEKGWNVVGWRQSNHGHRRPARRRSR